MTQARQSEVKSHSQGVVSVTSDMLAALKPLNISAPMPPPVIHSFQSKFGVPPALLSEETPGISVSPTTGASSKRGSIDSSKSPLQAKKQRVLSKDSSPGVSGQSSRSLRSRQSRRDDVFGREDEDDDDGGRVDSDSDDSDPDYVPQRSGNPLNTDDDLAVPMPDARREEEDNTTTVLCHPMSTEAPGACIPFSTENESQNSDGEEGSDEDEESEVEPDDEEVFMSRYVRSGRRYVWVAC